MKLWIEKLKDSTQRDPILRAVYQLSKAGNINGDMCHMQQKDTGTSETSFLMMMVWS